VKSSEAFHRHYIRTKQQEENMSKFDGVADTLFLKGVCLKDKRGK
jgi:hypothetical protein